MRSLLLCVGISGDDAGDWIGAVNGFRKRVPWWLRIGAKMVLARLPVPYRIWKQLRIFEHGDMNQPGRALDTFLEHARTAGVLDTESHLPRIKVKGDSFNVLELGQGDSLFTALIARSLGASHTWLVDVAPFATTEMPSYVELLELLRQRGRVLCLERNPQTLPGLLQQCNGEYLTQGVRSLAHLPPNSVDFCFSNAVLEHVPKRDLALVAAELLRVLNRNGICVHLRFSDATWEGKLFRSSGFYTNRIRFGEMLALFERAGFECHLPRVIRWEKLPTARAKLNASFRQLPDEDLLVSEFDVVLRRKG